MSMITRSGNRFASQAHSRSTIVRFCDDRHFRLTFEQRPQTVAYNLVIICQKDSNAIQLLTLSEPYKAEAGLIRVTCFS